MLTLLNSNFVVIVCWLLSYFFYLLEVLTGGVHRWVILMISIYMPVIEHSFLIFGNVCSDNKITNSMQAEQNCDGLFSQQTEAKQTN